MTLSQLRFLFFDSQSVCRCHVACTGPRHVCAALNCSIHYYAFRNAAKASGGAVGEQNILLYWHALAAAGPVPFFSVPVLKVARVDQYAPLMCDIESGTSVATVLILPRQSSVPPQGPPSPDKLQCSTQTGVSMSLST